MDKRFENLSKTLGFSYSRYADDLTSSIKDKNELPTLSVIKMIITEEGFFINPNKIRYIAKGKSQTLSIQNIVKNY